MPLELKRDISLGDTKFQTVGMLADSIEKKSFI